MRITKFVHSCLLVETPNRVGLIDPGIFSWESGTFKLDNLERLDDIIITHEHADHMHLPFIQALLQKFKGANIVTTASASTILKQSGITQVSEKAGQMIELFAADHQSNQPLGPTPQNIGVHYLGKLTHPGDSHSFNVTKDILALPITAPWGTATRAAELGSQLKPKYIIPIHDWHYKVEARDSLYLGFEDFFNQMNIKFIKAVDGQPFQISDD